MVQLCPDSLLQQDDFFQATPLLYYIQHINRRQRLDLDNCNEIQIMQILIEACPMSLMIGDVAGLIPLHVAGN